MSEDARAAEFRMLVQNLNAMIAAQNETNRLLKEAVALLQAIRAAAK